MDININVDIYLPGDLQDSIIVLFSCVCVGGEGIIWFILPLTPF